MPPATLTMIRIYRSILRSDNLLTDRLEYCEDDFISTYDLPEVEARTLYLLIKLHGYQGRQYLPEAIQALQRYAFTHSKGPTFYATVRLLDEIQNYKFF